MCGLEVDYRSGLVNLFKVQGCDDQSCCLVEVVSIMLSVIGLWTLDVEKVDPPDSLQLLLALLLLATADKQMSLLCLAALNVHELVKLQHPLLTATPALAAFVEDGCARVMYATFSFSITALVNRPAPFPPTCHALLQRYAWVVIFGFWRRSGRGCRLRRGLCGGQSRRGRRQRLVQRPEVDLRAIGHIGRLDGLGRRRVVYIGMGALGARLDFEELIESQDARFAAFPA